MRKGLFLLGVFWLCVGCSTSEKAPEVQPPKVHKSLQSIGKEMGKGLEEWFRQKGVKKAWIALMPWVNENKKECVLGEKLAKTLTQKLKFQLKGQVRYVHIRDVSHGQYLFAPNFPWDYWISGELRAQMGGFAVYLSIYDVAQKKTLSLTPYFLERSEYFLRLYNLLLPQPPKGGFSLKEGAPLMGQKVEASLEAVAGLRRLVVKVPQDSFLRSLASQLHKYFSRPDRPIPKVVLWDGKSKLKKLGYGKQALLELSRLPFGRDRALVKFFLFGPEDWKTHLSCVFRLE